MDSKLLLIAGPCVIESKEHALSMAEQLRDVAVNYPVDFIFKASFDKANRTSLRSYRGPGLEAGLEILEYVKRRTGVPVTTDIHSPEQADPAGKVVDMIQIPAFLCRQTDLLTAAALTGSPVNIKKGQFMNPYDMEFAVDKVREMKECKIYLTERGTFFGYGDLVVDFRSLSIMSSYSDGVIFDATHSVQKPGGAGGKSGGSREYILPLAKAAAAYGVSGFFLEVHDNPDMALSDSASQLPLDRFAPFLEEILPLSLMRSLPYDG